MKKGKDALVSTAMGPGTAETHLFGCDWPLGRLPELVNRLGVPSKVLLAADEQDRETRAEVRDFRVPLLEPKAKRGQGQMMRRENRVRR